MSTLAGVLVGLVAGWLLFVLTDSWRERRAGLAAARAAYLEMQANLTSIRRMAAVGFWTGAPEGPRRTVYEAHAGSLLLVLDPEGVDALIDAYTEFDKVAWMAKAIEPLVLSDAEADDREFEERIEWLREEHAEPLEQSASIIEDAMVKISAAAIPRWRRFLISRAVRRRYPRTIVMTEQAKSEHLQVVEQLRRVARLTDGRSQRAEVPGDDPPARE